MTLEEAKKKSKKYIQVINKTKDTDKEWTGYDNAEMHEVKRIIQTLLDYIENESISKEKVREKIKYYIREHEIHEFMNAGYDEYHYDDKAEVLQELLGDD